MAKQIKKRKPHDMSKFMPPPPTEFDKAVKKILERRLPSKVKGEKKNV